MSNTKTIEQMLEMVGENNPLIAIKLFSKLSIDKATNNSTLFLTFANDEHLQLHIPSITRNILHALNYGFGFRIEQDQTDSVSNDRHFNKITSIKKALLLGYQRVIWMDTDFILLGNWNIVDNLFDRFPNADLIMADHSDNINNGFIMIRNNPWTLGFVDEWWSVSVKKREFYFADQGAMYLTILHSLNKTRGDDQCTYNDQCETDKVITGKIHDCFHRYLNCFNLTYNNRQNADHFAFLPQNIVEYRLNQWDFGYWNKRPYKNWTEDDYYKDGDWGIHSKDTSSFTTRNIIDNLFHLVKEKFRQNYTVIHKD